MGPSSDRPLCMVGRCFWANKGGRVDNRGERRGPLKEDVRRKLEDRASIGVFGVCCGICDVVMSGLGVVFVAADELSISDVDILLLLFGVDDNVGSFGVKAEFCSSTESAEGEQSSSSWRLADRNGS